MTKSLGALQDLKVFLVQGDARQVFERLPVSRLIAPKAPDGAQATTGRSGSSSGFHAPDYTVTLRCGMRYRKRLCSKRQIGLIV